MYLRIRNAIRIQSHYRRRHDEDQFPSLINPPEVHRLAGEYFFSTHTLGFLSPFQATPRRSGDLCA